MLRRETVLSGLAIAITISITVAVAIAIGLTACGNAQPPAGQVSQAPPAPAISRPDAGEPAPVFTGGANQMEVTLFFIRADGEALAPEKRRIFRTATVGDRARQTLQALFEGSEMGLLPPVPPGTTLREVYLTRDGTAYVDVGAAFRSGLDTGTSDAVYAVYAIVNTLAENFSEIQKVKILVDGDEIEDAGGHFNLARPLLPEMSLVSSAPPRAHSRAAQPAEPSPAPAAASEKPGPPDV